MSTQQVDEFHGIGGSYVVDKDGIRRRVEEPTRDHPEGNAPRDRKGNLIVFPEPKQAAEPEPAQAVKPADKKGGAK